MNDAAKSIDRKTIGAHNLPLYARRRRTLMRQSDAVPLTPFHRNEK